MMNKILYTILSLAVIVGLASCNKSDEANYTITHSIPAYNLYTSLSNPAEVAVGYAPYQYEMVFPANTIQVSVANMSLPGMSQVSFTTLPMKLETSNVVFDKTGHEVISFLSQNATNTGADITELSGILTQAAYLPPLTDDYNLPGYDLMRPYKSGHYSFLNYKLNGTWLVRSFWSDMTYRGGSFVSAVASTPISTEKCAYRIIMDLENPTGNYTASVIVYDLQLAENGPIEKALLLKNLPLKFNQDGYEVEGSSITPYIIKDGLLSQSEDVVVDKITMRSGSSLIDAVVNMTISDGTSVSFNGHCIALAE